MTAPLEGAVALVTGAGSGIGRACALELARRGADVALHFRRSRAGAEEAAQAVRALGRRAEAIEGDLTGAGAAARLVDAVRELRPRRA